MAKPKVLLEEENWTYEVHGGREEGDGAYEYVLHLDDESRNWNSWGWPGDNRIILFGTGIGQGNTYDHDRALLLLRFFALAPRMFALLKELAQSDLPSTKGTALALEAEALVGEIEDS
jgi:hypothetical protein